eukprot:9494684-Pyramimonas_sp.AAC.1
MGSGHVDGPMGQHISSVSNCTFEAMVEDVEPKGIRNTRALSVLFSADGCCSDVRDLTHFAINELFGSSQLVPPFPVNTGQRQRGRWKDQVSIPRSYARSGIARRYKDLVYSA